MLSLTPQSMFNAYISLFHKPNDISRNKIPTSLHSFKLTKRLSGVGKKISVEHKNMLLTQSVESADIIYY